MKNLFVFAAITLFMLSALVNAAAASYDFDLVAKSSENAKLTCAVISPLKVRNGLLYFTTQCSWEGNYVTVYLEGEYLPKEKLLEGSFSYDSRYTVNHYKEGKKTYYVTDKCTFRASPIDESTEFVRLTATKNCLETSNYEGEETSRSIGGFDMGEYRIASWGGEEKQEAKLEDSGIRFSDIYGEVEILLPTGYDDEGEPIFEDEEGWNYAKLDMELPYGTKLKLRERSGIILAVPGSEPYEMKTPENLYPYDETIVMLPLKQKRDSQIKLLGGQLWNNMKKMIKDGSMDIEMGQAVCGIKGTTFVLEEDGKTSTLKVIEGSVEFVSKTSGKNTLVNAGEMVKADSSGLSPKAEFDILEENKRWDWKPAKKFSFLWLIIGAAIACCVAFFVLRNKGKR